MLVLLQSLEFSFGYLTVSFYALIVAFSGWAFAQLALGAFNLFNPIVLGGEPLRVLYRAINRLDSKGLTGDEAVLRATSLEANRALRILAELMDLAAERASVDRDGLVRMVEHLLVEVQLYAQRKHMLPPASAWFIPEPAYPKWVEENHSAVSIALQTSTPLQPQMVPATDWLEKRSAELAGAAIEACVMANDRDAALRITRTVALTAETLARCYRIDDSIAFSAIIRDRCWAIQSENAAAVAVVAEPPLLLTNLLLGWNKAIASWADEIREVVFATKWDRASTKVVQIRGPARVWTAAQRLLEEVHTEHEIEGKRVTPDCYLRFALSDACILSLREFAKQLPKLLDDFAQPAFNWPSPAVKAMTGAHALQALAKARLVMDTIPDAVEDLESLRLRNDSQPAEEFESLAKHVKSRTTPILKSIAEAVTELRPDQSQSSPDLFGGALFTLVHHTEQAIASGDVKLVRSVFQKTLSASMILQEHVLSSYQPPTYQYNSALIDPTIDLLELSGLAMIYEVLRSDRSADPIRQAWIAYTQSHKQPERAAKRVLDMLDLADGGFSFGISQRDIARTGWEKHLADQIVEAGYAVPQYVPLGNPPSWTAPPIIKMLGVWEPRRSLSLPPRAIFAAQVIGPLSGESEETLRTRSGLRSYYERESYSAPKTSDDDESNGHDTGGKEDSFQ